MKRFGPILLAGCLMVLGTARGAAPHGAAGIRVEPAAKLLVGALTDGAPINTNRPYTYRDVPKELQGLRAVMQAHKAPVPLSVRVDSPGMLFILLWDGKTPAALGVPGAWEPCGTIPVGGIATTPWAVFRRRVEAGVSFILEPPDRWGGILAAGSIAGPEAAIVVGSSHEPEAEFAELQQQIRRHAQRSPELKAKLLAEAERPDAVICDDDRNAVDVVVRRALALARHLERTGGDPAPQALTRALEEVRRRNATELDPQTEQDLFRQACAIRRQIAFRNPLLSFDRIVFLKRHKQGRGERHMIDQYLGFNAREGGGIFVLESPFGPEPTTRPLVGDGASAEGPVTGPGAGGAFLSLELNAEATELAFAWTEGRHDVTTYGDGPRGTQALPVAGPPYYIFREDTTYHLFRCSIDGTGITRLTDGPYNDYDPCYLPDGNIAFISGRGGGNARCGTRPVPAGTLHLLNPDTGSIRPLSRHDTNEWHPSVDNAGMIVYTRWDYVDRDSDIAHHIWHCYPDGRNPRSMHGNYPDAREGRPWMEMSIRAVPGSHRYVATAAPHHGEAFGTPVLIDVRVPDDRAMSQVRRIAPEYHMPESEREPGVPHPLHGGKHNPPGEAFGTLWPLSEDFFLCVFDRSRVNYGIYLLDTFGNAVLLYADPDIPCIDPIPLRPRTPPPAVPETVPDGSGEGLLLVDNVYRSEFPWPEGCSLKELRVVSVFPKPNAVLDDPYIGAAPQSLARGVLGTAPVESDGSVFCRVPSDVGVYFQLLDEQGRAVQTMRSVTYLKDGEVLACTGCHEPKHETPGTVRRAVPEACRTAPASLRAEAEGSYPLTFPRLVQPVLNRHCLPCHDREPKAPDLAGERFGKYGWSQGFLTLQPFAWGKAGGNGSGLRRNRTSYSLPGAVGARAAALANMLAEGHHDVVLPPQDLRRITLWLDCNSPFYGAYREPERQARGEVIEPEWGFRAMQTR